MLEGIVRNSLYKRYKVWTFARDWIVIFLLLVLFMTGVTMLCFLGGSFLYWSPENWSYYINNGLWYFRLSILCSIIFSFAMEIYLFDDSYRMTLKDLGDKK